MLSSLFLQAQREQYFLTNRIYDFLMIFLSFFVNSFLCIITLRSQTMHLIRMSAPIRIIFQRFSPQGCCFFISTISFKAKSLLAMFAPPLLSFFLILIRINN